MIPQPRVTARVTPLEDCPGGAKAKMRKGIKAGLEVEATYALGPWLHSDGTTWAWKHSLIVRFKDPDTHETMAAAHWLASSVTDTGIPEPRYGLAAWISKVISIPRKYSADWVMFRDVEGRHTMKDLDTWLADRAAE